MPKKQQTVTLLDLATMFAPEGPVGVDAGFGKIEFHDLTTRQLLRLVAKAAPRGWRINHANGITTVY